MTMAPVSVASAAMHHAGGEPAGLGARLRSMVKRRGSMVSAGCGKSVDLAWGECRVDGLCRGASSHALGQCRASVRLLYIAQQVSERTGIPYVLDFDDAWSIT